MDDLLLYAEKRGHRVIYFDLPLNGSVSFEDGVCVIGLDPRLSRKKARVGLCHELGHCENAGFYDENTPHWIRMKTEHRARAWSYETIVPPCAIRRAISSGASNDWELAEALDVPQDFITAALTYYRDCKEITF